MFCSIHLTAIWVAGEIPQQVGWRTTRIPVAHTTHGFYSGLLKLVANLIILVYCL